MGRKILPENVNFRWIVDDMNREADQPYRFGARLRQIRKDLGETQDEFAARIGTSKQVLSRYENGQRIPKISLLERYARSLNVSVDYLMGNTEEQEVAYKTFCAQDENPFYMIFLDVLDKMKMSESEVSFLTGLSPWQVDTIVNRRMREAPLSLAFRLSKALDVPLEVWTGDKTYEEVGISAEARMVAKAYDQAAEKDKTVIKTILELPKVEER